MSVVAIPPSFNEDQSLETKSTVKYLQYLHDNGAKRVMTTAGTSQFNLLSLDEIHELNASVTAFPGDKILGVPPLATKDAIKFIRDGEYYSDNRTHFMLLYPDRFYSNACIIEYVSEITEAIGKPVYMHTQKMRHGIKGSWEYNANVINSLKDKVVGIKEEISDLKESYDFVNKLHFTFDIIVAGGSMRRFAYLNLAGANSFLSGLGNFEPKRELDFQNHERKIYDKYQSLDVESNLFDVFMKYGWHRSLRYGLKFFGLTCFNNRNPWPKDDDIFVKEIEKVLKECVDVESLDFRSVLN